MRPSIPADFLGYVQGEGVDASSTQGDPGDSYHVDENAPGFVGFGSDGGGEMLAFDGSGAVYMIPFVGMCVGDAKKIASSWNEVAARITVENDV